MMKKNSLPGLGMALRQVPPVLIGVVAALGGPGAFAASPISDDCRIGGFVIGPQAGCFKNFSVYEAIDKTAQAGARAIEFSFRLKKLAPDRTGVQFNSDLPDAEVMALKAKLAERGIRAVSYGAVPIPADEAGARKVFEFARKLDLPTIITESEGSIDVIEKLVREYDIRVAFHNHYQRENEPNYRLWDPKYVRALIANRDHRIGACPDVGHWQTSGIRAIDGLRILEGRILAVHLKDRPALGTGQHDVVFGAGISDIGGLLAELRRQHFDGHITIEYEWNWDDSVPDIAQCLGFVRGWAAAKR
jgi:sugar phosphate isomerase/epimerase